MKDKECAPKQNSYLKPNNDIYLAHFQIGIVRLACISSVLRSELAVEGVGDDEADQIKRIPQKNNLQVLHPVPDPRLMR